MDTTKLIWTYKEISEEVINKITSDFKISMHIRLNSTFAKLGIDKNSCLFECFIQNIEKYFDIKFTAEFLTELNSIFGLVNEIDSILNDFN